MPKIRSALISFGVFWVSLWAAWVFQLPSYDRLINAIVRDETVLSALAMGLIGSIGRTLAAILAGVLVTAVIASRRSELWALVIAVLYVVDAPVRHYWGPSANSWDRLSQGIGLVFPAVACIAAAFVTAHLQRKNAKGVTQPSVTG